MNIRRSSSKGKRAENEVGYRSNNDRSEIISSVRLLIKKKKIEPWQK
jgi:hypothetical protein